MAEHLAVEVVEGRSAYVVGVPRGVARGLALDAGLKTMFDPVRRAQAIRAADVDQFADYVLAAGRTIVIRREPVT